MSDAHRGFDPWDSLHALEHDEADRLARSDRAADMAPNPLSTERSRAADTAGSTDHQENPR